MFSMCSELTPRARIPDTRIPQFMQPWGQLKQAAGSYHNSGIKTCPSHCNGWQYYWPRNRTPRRSRPWCVCWYQDAGPRVSPGIIVSRRQEGQRQRGVRWHQCLGDPHHQGEGWWWWLLAKVWVGVLVSWLYRLTGRQDNCLYCVIYCSTAQLLTAKCYFLFGFWMDLICFKRVVMCPSSLMLNHLDSPMALFNWKWHHVSCFRWCLNQIVDERETLFWKSLKSCLFIRFDHSC